MSSEVQFIRPVQLATLLRDPEQQGKTVILDVREDDYDGGCIRGAIHKPHAENFYDESAVNKIIDEHLNGPSTERVVVHCMLSQVRGPRSAKALASALEKRGRAGQPAVLVLSGGWESFSAVYRSEPDLIQRL
ncbi:rhodanese domain phosphatase [Dunaliella salina]|uniref:Rhodanese domain phosphatase n=1 Tax=Dunaliella salina TaxID=3046 RepID=A0ABQ7G720_DUNSA|nr:rhodanese domain phosphatase [Dunaliella salina]|eukprot:KAF5830387.1 rhodanese domain phosphatase [Dunaliella salina]